MYGLFAAIVITAYGDVTTTARPKKSFADAGRKQEDMRNLHEKSEGQTKADRRGHQYEVSNDLDENHIRLANHAVVLNAVDMLKKKDKPLPMLNSKDRQLLQGYNMQLAAYCSWSQGRSAKPFVAKDV